MQQSFSVFGDLPDGRAAAQQSIPISVQFVGARLVTEIDQVAASVALRMVRRKPRGCVQRLMNIANKMNQKAQRLNARRLRCMHIPEDEGVTSDLRHHTIVVRTVPARVISGSGFERGVV